ncbi:MAG TPA: FtsX-like permease family protein [Blastocatellia bacterium]|jgi:putative ABC transport system permease protein|nr:FtsX-like permease family protein [Blastocatellia bacterium]
MNSLNRKLIRDVIHLRGQVIAVALVVACGVAAFVAMRSVHHSLLDSQDAYYRQYRFADVFANLKRAPETLAARIRAIPGVAAAEMRIVANVTLDVPGVEEPARGRIISIPERQSPMLNDLHITSGRYIEAGKRDEVIVSGAFSDANNLHPGDALTAVINGRWQKLRIAGVAISPEYVYEIGDGEMFPDSRRFGVMWMSRDALGPAFYMDGAFNDVALQLSPGANESEVIEKLDALLEDYGALGAYGRVDQTSNYFTSNKITQLRVTSAFTPAIFLGVTAFLIHLTLSRLVATQRDQIAVLKAFGYGNLAIGLHYLKLAFVATLGGVALGVAMGWWFGYKITAIYAEYFFRFPVLRYTPGAGVVLSAVAISLASSGAGALAAVWRAASLPPAEAMRPEPPARFSAGFIERFGLNHFLSPAARIIVRNLSRRPVKAFLSTLGISFSVALLVGGFYLYYDAISRAVDVVFRTVYREDISIIFNDPRPASVRHDITHLPGVMRVEAQRSVPAWLRFEHRARRLALTGMESGAELWHVVDADYRVHEPPPDGVTLSKKLAEWLGVKPGDMLTVEAMEGERPVRRLTVAGTVDDLVGMSAYMDIRALNRLMREGGSVSGLQLMVDKNSLPALYATLKKTPAVRSVIVHGAMLDNFNKTIAGLIEADTAVLIFFACAIAFGVIYNSARIALSERGRELASLRVLGFTEREVTAMLLGEQALLAALAIPLGCALGWGLSRLITWAIETELMRLPLVVSGRTYARASIIVVIAAVFSGLLVIRRLRRLDLIEVLKTRE